MPEPLPLEEQVIAALRRITRAIDLHSRLLMKSCGLTAPQLAALRALDRGEPLTAGAVARKIHLGQATVSGILNRLEKRDLITRSRDVRDRRSVMLQLTEAGRELVSRAPSPLQEQFHRRLSKLAAWEQTMILATLQRIASMMDAEGIEASPMLASGTPSAAEDEISRYLENAVLGSDDSPGASTDEMARS